MQEANQIKGLIKRLKIFVKRSLYRIKSSIKESNKPPL